MKRKLCYILIAAMLVVSSCGCGAGGQETSEETGDLRAEIEALKTATATGGDNSEDAYAASLDTLLQVEEPAGALEGGRENIFLGASGAYYFKKHYMEKQKESWDELAFVNGEGVKGQERFDWDEQNVLRNAGSISGTDHYLTLESEYQESGNRHFLAELDENRRKVREIPLNFPDETDMDEAVNGISSIAMDSSGTVHLARKTADGWKYQLLSAEGELLADYVMDEGDILKLTSLYDGRIAFWTGNEDDWLMGNDASMQTVLRYLDAETGRAEELAVLEQGVYFCTLLDEKTMLYADREGVYRSTLSGKNPEPLYLWVNHNISVQDVYAMEADGPEKIRMIYEDEEGCHYLCLEPSTGEESANVCEITLAVSSYNDDILIPAVVEFNKKYPGCHIRIKTDYDETALLTELIAGEGPVLVDTALTGFAEQEKLWQPLDSAFEQLGITDELWPAALEAGKIGGTQYGVPTSCSVWTLGTVDPNLEDWNYDTFLQLLEQCIESRQDFEAAFNSYEGYGTHFIVDFFIHGIEDSYFWDAEKGTTDFDSEKFRRVLKIAREYVEDKGNIGHDTKKMLEGKLFCYEEQLNDVSFFISSRIHFSGQLHYIGYPYKDGAAHQLRVNDPLAIRRTASEEEKLAAYAFLDFCVSYDTQNKMIKMLFNTKNIMSVRRDMLEAQLNNLKESGVRVLVDGQPVPVKDYTDVEQDGKLLYEMFENAKPWGNLPKELLEILEGELGQYFDGIITEDMLIDHLDNRVGLYLKERK